MENITISTLSDRPNQLSKTLSIIEKEFHYSKDNQFAIDFYPLIEEKNATHNYVLFDEKIDSVIGHVGVLPKKIQIGNEYFPVKLIGGVAIDERYQGKGLFKKIFSHIDHLHRESTAFYLLWSDLTKFYKNFGFNLAFGQYQISLNNNSKPSSPYQKVKFAEISSPIMNEMIELYHQYIRQKCMTFQRSNDDWASFQKIVSSDLYLKFENNQLVSYFFMNKGEDLKGIIHELVIPEYRQDIIEELPAGKIWLPETPSVKSLKDLNPLLTYQSLMKIASHTIFNDFVKEYTKNKVKIKSIDEEEVYFIFDNQEYQYDLSDFIASLLGPNPVDEFKTFHRPFFISGLESI